MAKPLSYQAVNQIPVVTLWEEKLFEEALPANQIEQILGRFSLENLRREGSLDENLDLSLFEFILGRNKLTPFLQSYDQPGDFLDDLLVVIRNPGLLIYFGGEEFFQTVQMTWDFSSDDYYQLYKWSDDSRADLELEFPSYYRTLDEVLLAIIDYVSFFDLSLRWQYEDPDQLNPAFRIALSYLPPMTTSDPWLQIRDKLIITKGDFLMSPIDELANKRKSVVRVIGDYLYLAPESENWFRYFDQLNGKLIVKIFPYNEKAFDFEDIE